MKGDGVSNNLAETVSAAGLPLNAKSPVALPAAVSVPGSAEQQAVKLAQQWNTKNLGFRVGADAVSAACAASMIAPFISIIDRSIMENTSGRSSFADSLKTSFRTLLTQPRSMLFSRPVALIFMLYGGTYLTANTLDTVTSTLRDRPAGYVTSGTAKFAASSTANIGLCIYKDSVYVRLFGPGGPPRPVPLPSYALFALRDCFTIFASFNVPPLLGPIVSEHLSTNMRRHLSGETVAQFAAPAAVQLFSTPIHLLGLDMYNRPASPAISWADRWALVKKNWLISCAARICRIVPAFGLGGTVNVKVRRNLMEKLS
ncbi:hypothetical protein F4777DRAFT_243555 [Nemania sp. FL0916]|nr:hypothetical protein F4777DRAFT_243555 [Nemania sp. FL0916]